jgi:hypothetical protein
VPGIRFAYVIEGDTPIVGSGLFANLLSGTGAPPAAYVRAGDALVSTTKSTLTANGVAVVRMLLAADKTALYKEGTPVAGILGISQFDASTDGNGIINGNVTPPGVATGAGITYSFPSMSQTTPVDSFSNRSRVQYYTASPLNVFVGALGAGSANATPALNNTLAGLLLTTTAGVTTYNVDTTAGATQQCLTILRCDESDPLYGTGLGRVFFQFLPSFSQATTGVNYSTN